MKHMITITQVLRVERQIEVEIHAACKEAAIDLQMEDESPPNDDERWKVISSELMNEEVT